jgi:hypothetical protein
MDSARMVRCVAEVIDGPAGGDDRLCKDLPPEHPAVWHGLAPPDEDVGIGHTEVGLVVLGSATGGVVG